MLRGINDAVNGRGYSITQEACNEQVALFLVSLDALKEWLAQRCLPCGEAPTEAECRSHGGG